MSEQENEHEVRIAASEDRMLERDNAEEMAALEEQQPVSKKQRVWQVALGWAFGFGIWFCLALGAYYPDNVLMSWLFLVVFVAALGVRNQVEKRTGISMRTFMKHLLISLIVFLGVYIILGPVTGIIDAGPAA